MNIAFVRGAFLNPWELQSYSTFASAHRFRAIGADWQFYEGPIDIPSIPVSKAHVWGSALGRLQAGLPPKANRALSWTTGRSFGLRGLEGCVGDAEILHAAETFFTMTYQCLEIKRKTGKKLVLTVWENLDHQGETHPWRRARKRAVLNEADGFLAVTQRTADLLRREGVPPDRIHVIPMAVDTQRFSPGPRPAALASRLGIGPSDKVVLFIGRFVPEKGIEDLLRALPDIVRASSGSPVRFLFLGAGPLLPLLLRHAKSDPSHLIVQPFVDYAEVPAYHRLADVLVLPSRPARKWEEQFGYVLIESMACGKPVVSTRSGSIPDVVGDAGLLVSPQDPPGIAAAIRHVLFTPEGHRLGAKALDRVKREFHPEVTRTRLEALYGSVLSHPRS